MRGGRLRGGRGGGDGANGSVEHRLRCRSRFAGSGDAFVRGPREAPIDVWERGNLGAWKVHVSQAAGLLLPTGRVFLFTASCRFLCSLPAVCVCGFVTGGSQGGRICGESGAGRAHQHAHVVPQISVAVGATRGAMG